MEKSDSEYMNKFSEEIRKLSLEHDKMMKLGEFYNTPVKFDHIKNNTHILSCEARPHGKYAVAGFIAGALIGHFCHPLWGWLFKTI